MIRRIRKEYLAWERGEYEPSEESFPAYPIIRCLCLIIGVPEDIDDPGSIPERVTLGLEEYNMQDLLLIPMNEYIYFLIIFREDITSDRIIQVLSRAGLCCVAGVADYKENLPATMSKAKEAAESTFESGQTIAISGTNKERLQKPEEPVLYPDYSSAVSALTEAAEADELMRYFEMCVSRLNEGNWSQAAFFTITENVLISLKTELMRRYPETEFAENALRHINRIRLRATLSPDGFLHFMKKILNELTDEVRKQQGQADNSAVIRKARSYAARHCGETKFSLQETADHVGLSKNHFSRVFHDSTGVRFWDYVTELRIHKAATLLTETALPISVIAEMCGYETEAYFNKKFKQLKGDAPGKYRKRYGQ